MKGLFNLLIGFAVSALFVAGAASAEEGKAVQKLLVDNDKVRVFEVTFTPGDATQTVTRPARVIRALQGGTLTATSADGKVEKRAFKNGEVKYFDPETSPTTVKNEGKSTIVLYAVFLKGPKK